MRPPADEPIETFLARLSESDQAALTDQLARAVLYASRAAACVARTGRYREATTFQLLSYLTTAEGELQTSGQLVRERLQAPGEPDAEAGPPGS